MAYHCSVCQEEVEGDLVVLKDHTDKHIIDLLRHDHPDWVNEQGVCQKCVEYYRAEINGSIFKDAPCAIRLRKIRRIRDWFKGIFK